MRFTDTGNRFVVAKGNREVEEGRIGSLGLAMQKNEVMPFAATQMDLEGMRPSEISQPETDKYYMI